MNLNHNEIKCRGCHKSESDNPNIYVVERHDAYNFSTGYWCEDCYENTYLYKRGRYYDYLDAGEYLDDDY